MIAARSFWRLARWLGPWADATRAPDVAWRDDRDTVSGVRVRVYGRAARETFVIAPGLHYAGPDDPRMDRFCRILANAGHLVVAPYIAGYLRLIPGTDAIADFGRVLDRVDAWDARRSVKPAVFSISFGSLLALAAAATRGDAIGRLVVFGGYADFHATMRFCLSGDTGSGRVAVRDPLNQPVVMMNLLPHLCDAPADREELAAGWRRYVEATWGRPEMKDPARFGAVAAELAAGVDARVRELFLVGIGAAPGAEVLAYPALDVFDARPLDPRPYLPRVTCRVDLVHGADDDVIPFEQTHALAAGLTHARSVRTHVTGLYGHTGASRPTLRSSARELRTMLRILRALT
jgi:pimeloyl-ACP methyl ester carboxylesterase